MFKGFNVSLDSLTSLPSSSIPAPYLASDKKIIQESLHDFMLKDGSIDGEKLKNTWFPNINKTHIFISHSHKDLEFAKGLANFLYHNFNILSFIDSHVWNYANDLLRMLDNKHALNPTSGNYSYEVRNETTSHIHMMLSSALNHMIDSTECLFFLNTHNAINNIALSGEVDDHRTASAWIMSELTTSNIVRKKQNVTRRRSTIKAASLEESALDSVTGNEKLVIHHKAPVDHLTKLDVKELSLWCSSSNGQGYDALTVLYNQKCGENFDLSTPSQPK